MKSTQDRFLESLELATATVGCSVVRDKVDAGTGYLRWYEDGGWTPRLFGYYLFLPSSAIVLLWRDPQVKLVSPITESEVDLKVSVNLQQDGVKLEEAIKWVVAELIRQKKEVQG